MNLALRPYVTAGVALVGASVIAVTPLAAPPPAIQTHAVQLSAAVDNPIDVFAPVFDKANTVVQAAIQAEVGKPFPILNALIGKAAVDAQMFGGMANEVAQSFATVGTTLPPALQAAFQSLAAGDFNGYVAAFTPVFMGPFLTFQNKYIATANWVRSQLTLAGQVAYVAINAVNGLTIGQALNLLGPINAITNTLTELAQVAIPSGDPGTIINTIQHGIANISVAGLTFADNYRSYVDSRRIALGKLINPPTALAALASPAPPNSTMSELSAASATESPTTAPEVGAADTGESAAAGSKPESSEPKAVAVTAEQVTEPTKPSVRNSLVAVPGKAGATTNKPAAKVASDVRDGISSTVNKIGESVKKAFTKPEKKPASATSSDKGPGSSSSSDSK
ncbi:hypothetical protein [Mycolicibacterium fortuitum]|uniref:PE-PGRS family protein n=2 Tax=Mycolicibacterium fortuitum TaxID=1766 RepID=A0AAE4VEG8_MYCFO|nr:hypothetical protein [Mycolicibacterium fortuitum]MCV7142014.1 hypothetical protein [Mycolicibacterium fortuitum]MDV7192301.1 hypothetical protein [Mycolicibacterium fortuitum]MDV7205032.1 hypothetical protein [Mycolicibacterium fortuitum]MDV7226675.1 hypothetical protein [Mycolicibacterium fortuitum]MDV7259289.1 hypothetical protein [Mycolicibacterium fortuitum]